MSFVYRLRRFLGLDTITTYTKTTPIYDYTIYHTNGETSTERAHGFNVDGAFIRVYVYKGAETFPHIAGPGHTVYPSKREVVRVLDSIREVEKTKVGETTFEVTIDLADGTVVNESVRDTYE